MTKHVLFLLCAAFLFFGFSVTAAAIDKIPIAVMKFETTNLDNTEVKLLLDFFNNALFETGVFDVVQPDKRDNLLKEQEFSKSDLADRNTTRNIGKLLSVKLILFGSIGKLGSNILFNVTTVDVETGRTISTFSQKYATLEMIVDMLPEISDTIGTAASQTMFVKKSNVLQYDDFEESRWNTTEQTFYKNGKFHVFSKSVEYMAWDVISVEDMILELDTEYIEGSSNGGYGALFRFTDIDNFYYFCVSKSGSFVVGIREKGEYRELIPWIANTAINKNGKNRLKLSAIGANYKFYINNILVKEVFDKTFKKGDYGFFTFSDVHAAYDNLLVYQGNLLSFDSFRTPSENWSEGTGAFVKDEMYTLNAAGDGYYSWGSEVYDNISFRADAYYRGGSKEHGYGLVFRFQDVDNHYSFSITKNGFYLFGYFKDGEWVTLVDWKKSRLINPEGKTVLRVECLQDIFSLYINDNLVETIQDSTYSIGNIGFVTYKDIKAGFDNVEVFKVE
ncbi:MAG: hypothetical protein JW904_07125 [Spirochaetales bacterium]|nr:hypothetical protein [Spirochaetales bacterium]